jgi:phosphoglycerate dehydrogenase-like enzyme
MVEREIGILISWGITGERTSMAIQRRSGQPMSNNRYKIYVPVLRAPEEPQRAILDPLAEIITGEAKNEAELISCLQRADAALIPGRTRITRSVMEACPNLKLIAKYGVAVDNIDVHTATELGIAVTNAPGVNSNAVAEMTIGLMLAVMRRIQFSRELIRTGTWEEETSLGRELIGSTVGIVGYGNIARLVIRKLQGFEVRRILVFTESKRLQAPEFPNVEPVGLETLLRESDIVSLHKALTPQSRGMIGEGQLRLMKRSAFLINTSRGALLEEAPFLRALQERWIAGAALDVYEQEPLSPRSPLLSMNHVVLTPHIGGATYETRERLVTTIAQNIANFLTGREIDPKYQVNPEAYRGKKR